MPLTCEKVLNGVCLNESLKHNNRIQHITQQYRINLSETICHNRNKDDIITFSSKLYDRGYSPLATI